MQDADPSETQVDPASHVEVTAPLGQPDSAPAAPPAAFRPEGGTLGRYALLSRIGHGGMGEVHVAYDPQLKREVALKLVRPHRSDPAEQARLLREAQAMAQLSHPNVAAVYDAGEVEGQVFIAMEYIEGGTLADWVAAKPRSYREILQVFDGAGRGLAAAHAVGLIHRDFKPTNVIVGTDGRARVLDFGLARLVLSTEDIERTAEDDLSRSGELDVLATPLTEAGMVMGTPAYMAPEQHYGGAPAPSWDVYAFCVALYEALYRKRPFSGVGVRELAKAKHKGLGASPPSNTTVPNWIYGVLRTGLEPNQIRRAASMNVVLAQLRKDPARRRRRWRATGLAALGGGALAAAVGYTASAIEDPCSGATERVGEVWNVERAAAVEAAFGRTDLPYAAGAWARVKEETDAFVGEWGAARVRACEATHVRNEQSGKMLDLRMACLGRSERELDALLEVFATADEGVIERAHLAIVSLPDPRRCDDTDALSSAVEPPRDAETAEQVGVVRDELSRLAALKSAGRYEQATDAADEAVEAAMAIDYGPLVAETLVWRGYARDNQSDFDAAVADFEDAFFLSVELRDTDTARRAAIQLARTVGLTNANVKEGLQWARHARASAGRGIDGTVEDAEMLQVEGSIELHAGEFDSADELLTRALDIYLGKLGPDDRRIAVVLNALGDNAQSTGRFAEAEEHHRHAIEILERALGPDHPAVTNALGSLGLTLIEGDKLDEAEDLLEEALNRQRIMFGPTHREVARHMGNFGLVHLRKRENQEARAHFRGALEIVEAAHGPTHPTAANLLNSIAACEQRLGNPETALEMLSRALPIREAALGPDHIEVALAYSNVGVALYSLKRFDEALPYYEESVAIAERGAGPDHFRMARLREGLGNVLLELKRPADAARELEKSLEVARAHETPAKRIATLEWRLAAARWDADLDRAGAIELVEEAQRTLNANDAPNKRVDAWLAEHRK